MPVRCAGNGTIDEAELQTALARVGTDMSAAELQEMMESADKDGDHLVSFEEYCWMMLGPFRSVGLAAACVDVCP